MTCRSTLKAAVVYGLFGLAATVVVAWAIAAFARFDHLPYESRYVSPNDAWLLEGDWTVRANVGLGPGLTHWNVVGGAHDPNEETFITNVMWYGWPVRALEWRRVWDQRVPGIVSRELELGLPIPKWVRTWASSLGHINVSHYLPVLPLWRGLVVDTLVWALVGVGCVRLWIRLRGGRRARRGACRACGYPCAGIEICPECGRVQAVRDGVPARARFGGALRLLAAGLVISLVTALACAWMPIRFNGWNAVLFGPGYQGFELRQLPLHMSVPESWTATGPKESEADCLVVGASIDRGLGYRNEIAATHWRTGKDLGPARLMRLRTELGWPWTALVAEGEVDAPSGRVLGPAWLTGVALSGPSSRDLRGHFDAVPARRLPIRPAWTLIADVLFWAVIAWGAAVAARAVGKRCGSARRAVS